jgi:transcriptional regulator with XRE-family HTH domain
VSPKPNPTLKQIQVARKLRRMREKAKLTLEEAAPILDKTTSALSRLEKAETRVDIHIVKSMMDLYDQYDDKLLEEVKEALKPGWWHAYDIDDRSYISMEDSAARVAGFQTILVPGLLQTENYMRALFDAVKTTRTNEWIDQEVAARLIRQKRLVDQERLLEFVSVIDEAALHRMVGGTQVMHEQLCYMAKRVELANVTLQVIPLNYGSHRGMEGAFSILSFPENDYPDFLYVEYPTGSIHIEKKLQVDAAKLVFDQLRSQALGTEESIMLIGEMTENLLVDRGNTNVS